MILFIYSNIHSAVCLLIQIFCIFFQLTPLIKSKWIEICVRLTADWEFQYRKLKLVQFIMLNEMNSLRSLWWRVDMWKKTCGWKTNTRLSFNETSNILVNDSNGWNCCPQCKCKNRIRVSMCGYWNGRMRILPSNAPQYVVSSWILRCLFWIGCNE